MNENVQASVSADLARAVKAAAAADGVTVSAWMRQALEDRLARQSVPPAPLPVPAPGDEPRGWKSAATRWCQWLVARTRDGEPVSDADADALRQLARRHPDHAEKSGAGITGFTVATDDTHGKPTRHLVALRADGSSTDISWQHCVTPPGHRERALAGMRQDIAGQAVQAKIRLYPLTPDCALCRQPLGDRGVHVDHYPVPLAKIAEGFAASQGGWENVEVRVAPGDHAGTLLSPATSAAWKAFHEEQAAYRLVHAACHLGQPKARPEKPESEERARTAKTPPLPKTPKAARPRLSDEEKLERAAERKAKLAAGRVEARNAKVRELGGALVRLPALVTRDLVVRECSPGQAMAFLEMALGELSLDVEHAGYPIGHKDYALRTVQLGCEHFAVVLEPGEEDQAHVIRWALANAKVLHAHAAHADLVPLEHAGLCDAGAWAKMDDTMIRAKLADPHSTDSDEAGLKELAKALLGPDGALSWKCDQRRRELFAAGGWLTDVEVTTPVERSGWASVPLCEAFVAYGGADVMDCAGVARALSLT